MLSHHLQPCDDDPLQHENIPGQKSDDTALYFVVFTSQQQWIIMCSAALGAGPHLADSRCRMETKHEKGTVQSVIQ